MKTAIQIDLTFEQILSIVRQLSKKEKLRLSKELEMEAVDRKLSKLLNEFETDELDESIVTEEVDSVRQDLYDKEKH